VATAAMLDAVPRYLIENTRPLAAPYQGNKVKRSRAPLSDTLAVREVFSEPRKSSKRGQNRREVERGFGKEFANQMIPAQNACYERASSLSDLTG
jgi:hypothetical protein